MGTDWTRSETISPPENLLITWKQRQGDTYVDQQQILQSTAKSVSTSTYTTLSYIDESGKVNTQDVVISQVDIKYATKASANQAYVSWRLRNELGLPPGGDSERTVTTKEYSTGKTGPILTREIKLEYISILRFVAGLGLDDSHYNYYNPLANSGITPIEYIVNPSLLDTDAQLDVLSQKTIIEYETITQADGKEVTQTKNSSWKAYGLKQSGGQNSKRLLDAIWSVASTVQNTGGVLAAYINSLTELRFEGTEVQTSIGRAPVPTKPSDSDLANNEVANGSKTEEGTAPEDKYGNAGWTKYLPEGKDWKGSTIGDANLPSSTDHYNTDSDGDGVPDWAPFTPVYAGATDYLDTNPFITDDDLVVRSEDPGTDIFQDYITTSPFVDAVGRGADDGPIYADDPSAPSFSADVFVGPYINDSLEYAPPISRDGSLALSDSLLPGPFIQDNTGRIDYDPSTPTDFNYYDGTPNTWEPYVPVGPSDFDTSSSDYLNPTPSTNNDKFTTGRVIFDRQGFDSGDSTVTTTYDMPFAPDDYFDYSKKIRKLIRGGAAAAAEKFGRTESLLDIGHAFGQNIVTGFNEIPTLPLSPIYIREAGIEGAFLTDSISYAWGPEGMVASSDLMLVGVTGYYGDAPPSSSYLRLPVPSAEIAPAPAPLAESTPRKANTIVIPADFDPRNPAPVLQNLPRQGFDVFALSQYTGSLIAPTMELLTAVLTTRPVVAAVQYDYSISVDIETAILITRAFISERDDAFIPIPLITYSQSSVYSANDPATNATMTDDALIGSGTGTNDGVFEWIQLDIGGVYEVAKVVIGTATTQLPGGWDKSYTENRPIQYSIDGETWTTAGNTGTFAAEGIYELDLVFTARYIRITSAGDYLALMEFYPLAPEQPRTNYANLFTQPFIEYDDALIISGEVYQVIGTAAPILGATQVSPTSTATDDGWSLMFNGTQDEGSVGVTGFGFDFTLNNVAYTGCYVNANSYLTFGGTQNVYIGLGSSTPSLPKLLIGAADFSYQRIYTKSITGAFIIRWEGNIDYSAPAGSSNRFLEVTFYQVRSDGQQILEVRSGNHSGVAGVFMLATASTSLAQSTFAANESWVFIGNASGTDWTVASGRHAAIAES